MTFETKDSGAREQYASGMQRDVEEGKARFDLLLPEGVPYGEQLLTRFAELMARGAQKYGDRNWEQARGLAELDRFRSSALRHLLQWAAGETDEDHAAAVMFNLLGYETTRYKIDQVAAGERRKREADRARRTDTELSAQAKNLGAWAEANGATVGVVEPKQRPVDVAEAIGRYGSGKCGEPGCPICRPAAAA